MSIPKAETSSSEQSPPSEPKRRHRKTISPPLPADEATLIAAWYGEETLADTAAALGIGKYQLERAWRFLKRDRKLPQHSRAIEMETGVPHDGRTSVDSFNIGTDALLVKLYE